MKWLKSIFKKKKVDIPPIPPYEEIVKSLYDKQLDFSDELKICRVIYSKNNSKRFVILESDKGFFKYAYEEVCIIDELDWTFLFICGKNIQPGWWEPRDRSSAYSFFGTEEEAWEALKLETEYKQFFE